jgi:hypothetical protein
MIDFWVDYRLVATTGLCYNGHTLTIEKTPRGERKMSFDLSIWEEDYPDYLKRYDDDGGQRRKLSKQEFCELSEEMMNFTTWSHIRELTPDEQHRREELNYLLMD